MTTTTASSESTAAGVLPRAGARAVDAVLLLVAAMAVGGAVGFGWTWFVFQLALVAGYIVGLDTWQGTTVGKRLFRLRVVAGNGYRRPTVAEAAKREAVFLVGAVPFVGPVLAVLGFGAISWSIHRGDAIHDRLAGTDVVRY
jgi:uncharacterized RDD family membrane protein YckC